MLEAMRDAKITDILPDSSELPVSRELKETFIHSFIHPFSH